MKHLDDACLVIRVTVGILFFPKDSLEFSAFFKESSLGGQNREKRQNEKYEPSRFGERASLKRDFLKH
jgi:hypothetical protein